MNRIERLFLDGKKLFMPYVCCGDPDPEFTVRLVDTLVETGADAIELGIPFSDPIADGKIIQAASERALKNGMTPEKALGILKEIRASHPNLPIFAMTYYNIVFCNGVGDFVSRVARAGGDGIIVPDVPFEESDEFEKECEKNHIALIRFITPNMTDGKLKKVLEKARGFVYLVSAFGTTGARDSVSNEALELIHRTKKISEVPVVVGFGISNAKQAKIYFGADASGVIVGSALIEKYFGKEYKMAMKEVAKFADQFKMQD
jgi:tryptophan synthase alpha chain